MRFAPFHCTSEAARNPEPFTTSVNPPLLTLAVLGEIVVITGSGFAGVVIVNETAAAVPPPGIPLTTETAAVPTLATSELLIDAVNCVPLTYVVTRLDPAHSTSDDGTKPLPLTVRVKPADCAATDAGTIVAIAGAGLLIVNVVPDDVPPPGVGFITVTLAVPAVRRSVAGMVAVNCVALT
jgi:hypothetical protein